MGKVGLVCWKISLGWGGSSSQNPKTEKVVRRGLSGRSCDLPSRDAVDPDWPYKVGTKRINILTSLPTPPNVLVPIVQMSKMRLREMKSPGPGHTAGKWKSQDLNPVLLLPRATVLTLDYLQGQLKGIWDECVPRNLDRSGLLWSTRGQFAKFS